MRDPKHTPLHPSEELYRHLFDAAPDVLWTIDRSGTVRMANARTEQVLGYAPHALDGRQMDDLLGGASGAEISFLLKGLEEGSPMPEVEAEVRGAEGRAVPMMLDVREVDVDGEPHFLVRMRDLREIRALEQEYRNLFDGIADAVFIGNPETGQLYQANQPALTLTGRSLGQMMGQDYDVVHPETWASVSQLMEGGELHGFETFLRRDGDTDVPVEIHIRIVPRGEDDRIFIETAIDITARRALEQRMRDLRQEWESFMRHEMRNPLTPILAFSQILIEDSPEVQANPKMKSYLEAIYQGGLRMEQMLDLTREVHQYEQGQIPLQLFRTNIYPTLCDTIVDASLGVAGQKDLNSRVRLIPHCSGAEGQPAEELPVPHDGQKIQRALANLIKNALEHDPGEVTVTVEKHEGSVTVAVSNGGECIPPAQLETIFEKFNTTKRDQKGTGLGTTIAKLFVEAHGGTVRATSSPADGTTFTVSLPLS